MGYAWDSDLGNIGRTPVVTVYRLKHGESGQAILLGDPVGVWLHWVDGNSLPCELENCRWCPGRTYRRWYAPAQAPVGPKQIIEGPKGTIGTSHHAWVDVLAELNDGCRAALEGRTCRGLFVSLCRGKTGRAPLVLRVLDRTTDKPIPAWWDVRPVLERLWGVRAPAAERARDPEVLPYRRREAQ